MEYVAYVDFFEKLLDSCQFITYGKIRTYEKRTCRTHNPEVGGSNPPPAIAVTSLGTGTYACPILFGQIRLQLKCN